MKKIFLMLVILGLVFGCASQVRYNRPGMYESTKSETTIGIVASVPQPLPLSMVTGGIAAASETAKILRVYPECADRNTSKGALFECMREIDIKEGRIKPEDLKKLERPNLDEVTRPQNYPMNNSPQIKTEISTSISSIPPRKVDTIEKPQPSAIEKSKEPRLKPEVAPSEKPKSPPDHSIPGEKCNVPVWNVGDTWKFQGEDTKSWEAKVIRIDDKLYIRTSKSDSFFAYDKNTLGLKFYVDKEGKRTKPEDTFIPTPTDTFIYFDFPLFLGKKWAKTVSIPAIRQSIGPIPSNYLEEFECIAYENVTISGGTFETIKIKLKLTYVPKGTTGIAYIWYSPELKSPIKMIIEKSGSRLSAQQGFELISFNLKGKQPTSTEATKLPPQKAQTPSEPLPPLAKKPQTVIPANHPPITPQTAINKVEAPLKTPPSQPEKPQTIIPATPPPIAPKTAVNRVETPLKTPPSQPEKPQTIIPANLPPITPQTAVNKVAVTGIYANIRSGAGNEFPIIATVKQGDKLILLGEYGEWYIVRLENGQEGWISNKFAK